MKKAIFALIFLISFNAFACKQEAQFAASSFEPEFDGEHCQIKVFSFSHYSYSIMCPLLQEEVLNEGFIMKTSQEYCENMNTLSGYLVRNIGSEVIIFD